MKKYFRLLRVHHCIKNLIILLPVIFSYQLTDPAVLRAAFSGIGIFSLISFAVYIFNDICDIRNDRLHPVNKSRPLAAGEISKKCAVFLFCLFACGGFLTHFVCFKANLSAAVLLLYFVLNLLYSLWLKNIPVADIAVVASGYLLRLIYGSMITGISLSPWLYLTIIFGALYLVIGKRMCEKMQNGSTGTRRVLRYYSPGLLKAAMYLCLAFTVALYVLWGFNSPTVKPEDGKNVIFIMPLALLILFRYNNNLLHKAQSNPVDIIFSDKWLIGMISVFSLLNIVIFLG